jgi:Na+-dependent bicarbonate transporter superfamily
MQLAGCAAANTPRISGRYADAKSSGDPNRTSPATSGTRNRASIAYACATIAFACNIIATLIKSGLEIPEPVIRIFAIFLLLAIGLQGGRELASADLGNLLSAITLTGFHVITLPLTAFLAARYIVGLDIRNAAGVAALMAPCPPSPSLSAAPMQKVQAPR